MSKAFANSGCCASGVTHSHSPGGTERAVVTLMEARPVLSRARDVSVSVIR